MEIAVMTAHDGEFNALAQLTWEQNAKLYCDEHGYAYHVITDATTRGIDPDWVRMLDIKAALDQNPNIDWVVWIDCDTLITNFNIKLEDILDPNYHFMVSTYWNGMNIGVFAVQNTEQGRQWVQTVIDRHDQYIHHYWRAQGCMIDMTKEAPYKDWVKIVPQRTWNSACFSDGCHKDAPTTLDTLGTDGQWQPGDFLMHWPGQPNHFRMQLAKKYMPQVIR